ncbi:acyl-CoA thioesterase [Maricaulis salignorans]|uniref:Acyl-CoA thioester hydrolase n=1 Tax=Maricaulis salignorans TaxID=144026 RepID=A0A1G9TYJ2_9PROT|nr:acyl-CoA thioesterase [Maricaulis salignorans]SDM52474.1 acyl-CoA thioester hydrolase [Maricaulis salignorans]
MSDFKWDLPAPYVHRIQVVATDIDDFGHANNARYLEWADAAAWTHWASKGFSREVCERDDRGIAIIRTEADYLGHVREGDALDCAVWISKSDGRLRAERRYQFVRPSDGVTVFRALTKVVCFQLSTGKPARMTEIFKSHYSVLPSVAAALAAQD